MLNNIFLKGLRERRLSLIWWAVGLILFVVLNIAFYPSMKNSTGLLEYAESSPELMTAFAGGTDIISPAGYLNSQLFFLMLPIILGIFAISLGSDALAGEEGRGTLDLLLSLPISRRRVVLEKFATLLAGTVIMSAVLFVAMLSAALAAGMNKSSVLEKGIELPPLDLLHLAEATLALTLLALAFGSLALLIGAATGSRGAAIGVAAAVGLGSIVLNSVALVVGSLKPWRKLLPTYYYNARDPLLNGIDWHALVLLALTAAFLAAALFFFQRRDISA